MLAIARSSLRKALYLIERVNAPILTAPTRSRLAMTSFSHIVPQPSATTVRLASKVLSIVHSETVFSPRRLRKLLKPRRRQTIRQRHLRQSVVAILWAIIKTSAILTDGAA